MVADPHRAHDVLEHLRSVIAQRPQQSLVTLILAEQKSDSAEDVSQAEVLAEQSDENLLRYRDDVRRARRCR